MNSPIHHHDIVILGAGLSGLLCGAILSKNGYNVGIVEQHKQLGGCLQAFAFKKHLFDSCVHYIGGLNEGNNLYKILNYLEVLPSLELMPFSQSCFDAIILANDPTTYKLAQGYDAFEQQLVQQFPTEADGIKNYIKHIKATTQKFPLYHLKNGDAQEKLNILGESLSSVLDQYFVSDTIKQVLTGNSLLYAGDSNSTPFYVHALVLNSYIEGCYKIKGSSAQIAKALSKTISKYGGTIYKKEKITQIRELDSEKIAINTANNTCFIGDKCISSIHPKKTLELLQSPKIKRAFHNRIANVSNSISSFMVNCILSPQKVPYPHHNTYYNAQHPLDIIKNIDNNWPNNYALYYTEDTNNPGFAASVSILTYMKFESFSEYQNSYNTATIQQNRPEPYMAYKREKAKQLVNKVAERFPEISMHLTDMQIATPLTFRDYMGTDDGSIYGMIANYNQPMASMVPTQTKIPNLLFSGQNINIHGVLGVSITALATCGHIVGLDALLAKFE